MCISELLKRGVGGNIEFSACPTFLDLLMSVSSLSVLKISIINLLYKLQVVIILCEVLTPAVIAPSKPVTSFRTYVAVHYLN